VNAVVVAGCVVVVVEKRLKLSVVVVGVMVVVSFGVEVVVV
jgi:hypothetical protein